MASKTFKIGEYAIGGIIKATVKGTTVNVQAIDWNSKKVINNYQITFSPFNTDAQYKLDDHLNYLTSYYYAEKVKDWVKKEMNLVQELY